MKDAWIVVRTEKHIDDKFWVCLSRGDALQIARDVVRYWRNRYLPDEDDVDQECRGDRIFNFDADDCFHVYVEPQTVREPGEAQNDECSSTTP